MKTEETNQMKVAQSLVLANFSTTAPSTTRLNRSASARAIAAANAGANAARTYNTVLNSKGTAVGRAISIQQQAGVAIRRLGLPCPMGGIYLRDFVSEVVIPNASTVASRFTMRLVIVNQPVAVNKGVLGGLTTEVANRLRADSQRQITDMLRAAHAGPVEDMRRTLAEFSDRLRNAERLHLSQFDKLRSEAKRLTNLNILGLPELDELIEQIAPLCQGPAYVPSGTERVGIAAQAEAASKKADDTLAALGL